MLSKEWIVGFIEGEGNFNVALARNHKTPSNWKYPFEYYPSLQFRIFLREDDLEVLEKIKNTIGVGNIYKKSCQYSREKGINSRDQYCYYIASLKDLTKLRELLQSCEFHTKKKKDMEIFFKILDFKLAGKHLTREGHDEILLLAKSMNSKNRENFRVKPLAEYLNPN